VSVGTDVVSIVAAYSDL